MYLNVDVFGGALGLSGIPERAQTWMIYLLLAAATAAYDDLLASGELQPTDTVVLFNTGAGLKYTDMTAAEMHLQRPNTVTESLK